MRSLPKLLRSAVAASVLALAGGLASAADTDALTADLGHYFPIRTALAADTTDGVKEHALALAKSADKAVAKAATALSDAADIAAARKAFGDLSKALIPVVETAAKAGADLGPVYVFECPMAKPFGRWLQADAALKNPYYGSQMLTCGRQVAAYGAGAK